MKILCILQNAWVGKVRKMPLIFKVNPNNKSGKRMYKICEGHNMFFTNACSMSTVNSFEKSETDLEFLKQAVNHKSLQFDLFIVCGNQAKEAVWELYGRFEFPFVNTILMPHPASRTLTNKLCDAVQEEIKFMEKLNESRKLIRMVEYIQQKGKFKRKIKSETISLVK